MVAATRFEEQQPTWTVTGTDEAGLDRAIDLIDARALHHRYAVATSANGPVSLPAAQGRSR